MTFTTRAELEATVWAVLGHYSAAPRVHDVATILTAADAYAASDSEAVTAMRREQLTVREQRASVRAVHWLDHDEEPACRPVRAGTVTSATDPATVTCRACMATLAYRRELARVAS